MIDEKRFTYKFTLHFALYHRTTHNYPLHCREINTRDIAPSTHYALSKNKKYRRRIKDASHNQQKTKFY